MAIVDGIVVSDQFQDLRNREFGLLFVEKLVGRAARSGGKSTLLWLCRCRCGNYSKVISGHLVRRKKPVQSCGCAHRKMVGNMFRTHGLSKTGTYQSWASARARCRNPSVSSWHRYGGRGIKFSEKWERFENFLEDMGHCPPDHSLDRYPNPDGDYEPGNCRWATKKQQARNRCTNRVIEAFGQNLLLTEWAEKYGVPYTTIIRRLNCGWDVERAVSKPPRPIR